MLMYLFGLDEQGLLLWPGRGLSLPLELVRSCTPCSIDDAFTSI